MNRPKTFTQELVLLENASYQLVHEEGECKPPHTNGILPRGTQVWSQEQEPRQEKALGHYITVFANNVGLVSLNPDCLIGSDVLQEERRPNA